jgi:hypothetical protein
LLVRKEILTRIWRLRRCREGLGRLPGLSVRGLITILMLTMRVGNGCYIGWGNLLH